MSWLIRALVGALILTVMLSGCVVQQREDGTSSTARVSSRGKAGGVPVMKVNGEGVSARDLVASPHLRKSLRVFIHTLALEQEAVKQGVFCELGAGCVDFGAVLDWLTQRDYDGWAVVEQDVLPGMGSPKQSALRNRQYLRSIGV